MLISFENLKEIGIPGLNGGEGTVFAQMAMQPDIKLMVSRIPAGASIGLHAHLTSCDVNYVLSGEGLALCGGQEERLTPGVCHFCPKGETHSLRNTGTEDLVLFTVVPEQ